MILVFIIVFCALIALGFGAASAWSDFNRLIIPNIFAAYIGAAFIPAFLFAAFFAPELSFFASWKNHLISALLVFGATYALFHFNIIGGGDSKLLTVYALWTGLGGLMPLLFIMSLVGALLGLSTLALSKWKPIKKPVKNSWIAKSQSGGKDVPYGVAIIAGAVVSFWQVGYLQPAELIALATSGVGS